MGPQAHYKCNYMGPTGPHYSNNYKGLQGPYSSKYWGKWPQISNSYIQLKVIRLGPRAPSQGPKGPS